MSNPFCPSRFGTFCILEQLKTSLNCTLVLDNTANNDNEEIMLGDAVGMAHVALCYAE